MIASRLRRPALGLLLVTATVAATLLPPSHIHLEADHHDHHADVPGIEHSHWFAHAHHRLGVEDLDEDARVLFVDHPSLARSLHAHIAPAGVAVVSALDRNRPLTPAAAWPRAGGNAVRDGPPGDVLLLRGPPRVL